MNKKELEFIGFFAGEGCISIHKEKSNINSKFNYLYRPQFEIYLRKDDSKVLKCFYSMFGGSISYQKRIGKGDFASWRVRSKKDCWKVLKLLEKSVLPFVKYKQLPLIRKFLEIYSNRDYSSEELAKMQTIKELLSKMKKAKSPDQSS